MVSIKRKARCLLWDRSCAHFVCDFSFFLFEISNAVRILHLLVLPVKLADFE